MNRELKNCPFCGGREIRRSKITGIVAPMTATDFNHCLECRMTGPRCFDKRLADIRWNTRADDKANLKELREEYATQDNRWTAYPIYVTVQSLVFVCVSKEGYDGGDKTIITYRHPDYYSDDLHESEEEVRKYLEEYEELDGEELEEAMEEVEAIHSVYKYEDVEVFLTIKGALEYIKKDGHNLHSPRTYVKHFSGRNSEMRALLAEMGFKVKDDPIPPQVPEVGNE